LGPSYAPLFKKGLLNLAKSVPSSKINFFTLLNLPSEIIKLYSFLNSFPLFINLSQISANLKILNVITKKKSGVLSPLLF
jgi:hypothetical protein